jgi:hypothetical protein
METEPMALNAPMLNKSTDIRMGRNASMRLDLKLYEQRKAHRSAGVWPACGPDARASFSNAILLMN